MLRLWLCNGNTNKNSVLYKSRSRCQIADNFVFDKGTQIKCVKLIQIVFPYLLFSLIVSNYKTLGRGTFYLLDIINPYFNIMFTIIADNGSDLNLLMY